MQGDGPGQARSSQLASEAVVIEVRAETVVYAVELRDNQQKLHDALTGAAYLLCLIGRHMPFRDMDAKGSLIARPSTNSSHPHCVRLW